MRIFFQIIGILGLALGVGLFVAQWSLQPSLIGFEPMDARADELGYVIATLRGFSAGFFTLGALAMVLSIASRRRGVIARDALAGKDDLKR